MLADDPDTAGDLWILGYGSLVWRPDFEHQDRAPGFIEGWARRFWQGSTDHRGVPGAPGRVATLVPEAGSVCWGVAYRVAPRARDEVLARLDHREKGGFERHRVEVRAGAQRLRALVYIAGPGNPNYLGPAPLDAIAAQVLRSIGPSGPNIDYVLRLAEALTSLGARDPHVEELAELVTR